MKLHCTVDPVEALRRGVDAPETAVVELNPAVLSPAEREWLAGAVRKEESGSPGEPVSLIFPHPIPVPSVEGLREAIAARMAEHAQVPEHGLVTRFNQPQPPRPEGRPATPQPQSSAGSPVGEVAKAAGFLGLGALMGGMIDRVFGPHPQQPVDVIVEREEPREGSWGEALPPQSPSEPSSSCCDDSDGGEDTSADLADDDSDGSGDSGGDYDLV